MQVLILLLSKVLLAFQLAAYSAGDVVARVTDRLNLRNLAQHGAYLSLRIVRQMSVADVVEIVGYLNLHIVRDALILLDTGENLVELGIVLYAQQFAYHTEHTLNALCKRLNLLLCLKHRELRSFHDGCATDVAQAEIVLVLLHRRLDDVANEAFHLRNEPYQNRRVAHVEGSMESGKHHREACGVDVVGMRVDTHKSANHIDERIEYAEHPDNTEHIERQVRQGCTTSLRVGTHGGDVRSDGSAYILTQHKRDTHINRQHAARTQHHGDGHKSRRRLHTESQHRANEQEREYCEIAVFVER